MWKKSTILAKTIGTLSHFFHKLSISISLPPLPGQRWLSGVTDVANILQSKEFNIVQGKRGKDYLYDCLYDCKLLVSRSFQVKKVRTKRSVPNPVFARVVV